MSRNRRRAGSDSRWVARPVLAAVVRAAVLLVPSTAGAAAGLVVGLVLGRRLHGVLVLAMALATSAAAAVAVERIARRLLPLATLLKLSLVFPDRVPSRFRVARQAGNARVLHERIRRAHEAGVVDDPARAAEEILTLVAALSAHDRKTRGHSERVRAFTDVIAGELPISDEDRDRLRWAALLHDIGKLTVPAATLNKPGKPNDDEWEQLKRHPIEGERIIAGMLPWLGSWNAVIAQHHERFDGGGYPRALSGEDIHVGARIVSVADSFEVMTAARSYKRPMTPTAARRELSACAGKQFDPMVVRALFGISIGRLWWMVGPVAWVAQVPFMLGIGQAGSEAAVAVRTVGALAMRGVAAVLAVTMSAVGMTARTGATAQTDLAATRARTSTATSDMAGASPGGPIDVPHHVGDAIDGEAGSSSGSGGSGGASGTGGGGDGVDGSSGTLDGVIDAAGDVTDAATGAATGALSDASGAADAAGDQVDSTVSGVTDAVGGAASAATSAAGSGLGP